MVFDADTGCFVDVNENAGRLFGLDREQLLRVGPAELSPPMQPDGSASREQVRLRIERALDAGPISFEWLHRDAFGKEFMLRRAPAAPAERQPSARARQPHR